jgi:hypothetical protein
MLETNPVFLYLQMYVVLQISICNADKKFNLKDGLAYTKKKTKKFYRYIFELFIRNVNSLIFIVFMYINRFCTYLY